MVKNLSSTEKKLVGIIVILVFVIVAFFLVTNLQKINERSYTKQTKNYMESVFGKEVLKVGENFTTSQEYMNLFASTIQENIIISLLQQTNNCSSAKVLFGDFEREVLDTQCAMQAINEAYLQAVAEVYVATQECAVATLTIGNQTREVIDASCVQR
ncbi:MAG: hypothetical protein PHT94_01110 [Candidatus Nanoarchaeia archaeon]|nr:hypothetical protein [Candidatus Nanoarchaeia archaeon]